MKFRSLLLLTGYATLGFTAFSQSSQKGYWQAETLLDGGILKISWQHAQMQRTEKISNAVIIPSLPVENLPAKGNKKTANAGLFTLQQSGKGITIQTETSAPLTITKGFDSGHIRGVQIALHPQHSWYGGGQRATPLLRNGQRISLYNAPAYGYGEGQDQLNYSVPFVLTNGGYGIFFDNPSKGYIDFGKTIPGQMEAAFVSGKPEVYLIPGKTPREILQKFSLLTGRQPMPPLWTFGNFISRFGYHTQQQATSVVDNMLREGFPADAVIIDLFWFGKTIQFTLGNLDWDADNWPAPQKMIDDFAARNIKTILITEPFIIEGTKQYTNALPYLAVNKAGKPFRLEEFYFGKGGIIDLFQQKSRDWFWQFYKKQTDIGVAGWWGDLGEPENHPEDVLHNLGDLGINRKMGANEVHNIYGHYWSQMVYENWRKDYPGKRLFFLNRAGYAGSQRFSTFPWTGDVSRSWSGFRAQVPALQSMSISGIPFAHSDAGGFAMTDKADPELYTRWLQFAAFTPVFRPHGSALNEEMTPKGTISLPSEPCFWDAPVKDIARKVIMDRYRMLPYHYTLAWMQATQGEPLMRPMAYAFPENKEAAKATDQYMWGPALLAAPVLNPGEKTRKLYLPEGTWYNWYSHEIVQGGNWIEIPLIADHMPVFARGGSFIPLWTKETMQNTDAFRTESLLTLKWFPGIQAEDSYVYWDDYESPDAPLHPEKHLLMTWKSAVAGNTVKITATQKGTLSNQFRLLKLIIPVNGLPGMQAQPAGSFRVIVNGKNYFGGTITTEAGKEMTLFLEPGNTEIVIEKLAG